MQQSVLMNHSLKKFVHYNGVVLTQMKLALINHAHTERMAYPLLFCENQRQKMTVLIQQMNRFAVTITYQDVTKGICTESIWNESQVLACVGKSVLSRVSHHHYCTPVNVRCTDVTSDVFCDVVWEIVQFLSFLAFPYDLYFFSCLVIPGDFCISVLSQPHQYVPVDVGRVYAEWRPFSCIDELDDFKS